MGYYVRRQHDPNFRICLSLKAYTILFLCASTIVSIKIGNGLPDALFRAACQRQPGCPGVYDYTGNLLRFAETKAA